LDEILTPQTSMNARVEKLDIGDNQRLSSIAKREDKMMKKSVATALLMSGVFFVGGALFPQNSAAQTAPPMSGQQSASSIDQEIAMLRSDLRSNRKQVVAANMKLTDAEAEKFWPTYDQYINDLVKINDGKYALIKEYMQNTTMTDEQVDNLTKRWLAVDESVVQLRLKYIPLFRAGLSAKSTALFFQIDRRVQMLIDLQLASALPLIEP